MPVYLYRNLKTNETFEYEQPITAAPLTEHPATGDPVKRLIQPAGIAFKGSGAARERIVWRVTATSQRRTTPQTTSAIISR